MNRRLPLLTAAIILLASGARIAPADPPAASRPAAEFQLPAEYARVADRIIAAALARRGAYDKLERLCDDVGHRLSGSAALDRAIEWAVATLKAEGHENVHTEKVMVPHWVRGRESLTMIEPRETPLVILGLGGSVATPSEGITAEVAVVKDEDDLKAAGDRLKGKIVLFNNVMPPYDPEHGAGYGTAVRFRGIGAQLAAEHGAVACLVRSVTATSLRSPHTGAMRPYEEGKKKIPAAAVTVEDAELMSRLTARGKRVVVTLKMEAHTQPDAPSANVVAELRGSTIPEELVVMGGHIDSWDVGQGAHDDGSGCAMSMEALTLLRELGLRPKRTIRVVLWTNEENGLAGGRAYAKEHAAELSRHVAAIETDSGGFRPVGFGFSIADKSREPVAARRLSAVAALMSALGPIRITTGGGGADIGPLGRSGVPMLGLDVEGSRYFDYHHTPADTLDKVNPRDLEESAAAMAIMAYVLADMGRIDDPGPLLMK